MTARARRADLFALALAALAAWPAAAQAPAAPPSRAEVDRRLSQEREAASRELPELRAKAVAAAAAAQAAEVLLSAAEAQLATLDAEIAARRAQTAGERERLAVALAGLQRAARQPAILKLAAPGSALDAARAASLLAAIVTPLQADVAKAGRDLEQLAVLRQRADADRLQVEATMARLSRERGEVDALVVRREELLRALDGGEAGLAERLAALGGSARDLAELVGKLNAAREAAARPPALPVPRSETPPPANAFEAAKGKLLLPVAGSVVRRFGQGPIGDIRQRGIVLQARPAAQIVAPFDGRVAFNGPFRSYGHILILEHGGGYHSLLAGFGRTVAAVGRWVTAGEPLGTAAQPETGNPSLYFELRHAGQPIDPIPWFAAPKER